MKNHFSALLTDMDGTLIHSQLPICKAIQLSFVSVGKAAPSIDAILAMFGLPIEQMLVQLSDVTENDIDCISAFITEYKHQYPIQMIQASIIEGVADTLSQINRMGIPVCLITSERRSNVQYILQRLGLLPYITEMITRDEVTQCKPHPEPILAAARAVSVEPNNCLYIGESPFDMKAGISAGVYTVGVASGNWSIDTLSECCPNRIVQRFADIIGLF